ncbi:hypothetical protein ACFE04_012273 [Oxalis oulophora]
MEAPQSNTTSNEIPNQNRNSILSSTPVWPTIDGPLGMNEDESVNYARNFYKFGFALLPWLWALNCFYFWPVLRNSRSFPRIHTYVLGSAVGFAVFAALISSWALTFAIGGKHLFGPVWDQLVGVSRCPISCSIAACRIVKWLKFAVVDGRSLAGQVFKLLYCVYENWLDPDWFLGCAVLNRTIHINDPART